jgi:hypothetical protein
MTLGEVMARYYLANLGVFATASVLFLSMGVLIGCWIGAAWQKRRSPSRALGIGSWSSADWIEGSGAVFEPGVARVGEAE